MSLVKKYDGEFPKKNFEAFLKYINVNEKEFWNIIDGYRSPHLWKKENGKWIMKEKVK